MKTLQHIVVVVVGLVSMLSAMTATANATWTNAGDTAFTATTGPMTYVTAAITLTCSNGSMTGTAGTSSTNVTWLPMAAGSLTFRGCRIGGAPMGWTCTYAFNALTRSGGTATGTFVLSSPNGCVITGTTCKVEGTVSGATYINPSAPAFGILRVPPSSSLSVTGTGCPLGAGRMSLTSLTFTITSATGGAAPNLGPVIA